MTDLSFLSSKDFEVFAQISEKISQLTDIKVTLDEVLKIIKEVSAARHLAIRVVDSNGNIPFYEYYAVESNLA